MKKSKVAHPGLVLQFTSDVYVGVLGVFIPVLTAMIKVLRRWAFLSLFAISVVILYPNSHNLLLRQLNRHRFGEFLSITWRAAFALFLVSASIETLRWNDKQSRFHDIPRYDLIRQRCVVLYDFFIFFLQNETKLIIVKCSLFELCPPSWPKLLLIHVLKKLFKKKIK